MELLLITSGLIDGGDLCLKSDGNRIVINKEKNDVKQGIGKEENGDYRISVVDNDYGKREQKEDIGNDKIKMELK